MRRVLLGGLGIALGVFVRPAGAQEVPGRPAAPYNSPVPKNPTVRAARLGMPVAIPDAPSTTEVTPAGLIARGQLTPYAPPVGPGTPAATLLPVGGQPVGPSPLPPPRQVGSGPSVTEVRGPVPGGVPVGPPVTMGVPTVGFPLITGGSPGEPGAIPGTTVIPQVGPLDCGPGLPCPQPAVDAPLYGDPVVGGTPHFPALRRLVGCTDGRSWVSAENLMWWTRSTQLPPLVTTSSPAFNGIPGLGNTQTILGGSFGQTLHGGARFSGGYWFTDEQRRGIDASFLFLFRNGNQFAADTNTYPLLARPFFNVNTPVGPFAEVIGATGLAAGRVVTTLENSLWGADVNYRRFLLGNACFRLDGLVGFRYLNFTEDLAITETFVRTPGSPMAVGVPAIGGTVSDRFRAANNFYGGQIGLTGELRRGRWFVNGRSTIAFGTVHQSAEIGGGQALVFPNGQIAQFQGGLLALPGANIGHFSQDKFAVMPEIGLNLGYHITPRLRVFTGYNFLYLSSVVRAAGTIDTTVDAARIPNFPLAGNPAPLAGVPRPSPQLRTTDFWAQGINFGVQWTW
ncbi:MAG: hypothetical protein JWO38_2955 [Gemmataceae bacterium]|nr:hypothetical protein [Gemmataceae bacterium]